MKQFGKLLDNVFQSGFGRIGLFDVANMMPVQLKLGQPISRYKDKTFPFGDYNG